MALAGCGGSAAKVGDRGQACYPNQTCNTGLSCVDSFCVRLGEAGSGGGGAGAAGTGAAGTGAAGTTTGGAGTGAAGTASGAAGAGAQDGGAGSSPDAEAGAPDAPPPFSVLNVPGLAYWFDAGKGVTIDGVGVVTTWADQSGNGRTQSELDGVGPVVAANAINGRPVLRFATRFAALGPLAEKNVLGTGEMLVEMVATAIVDPERPSNLPFSSTGTSLWFRLGYDLAAKHVGFTLVTTGAGTPKNFVGKTTTTAGPHLVGFHRTGAGATAKLELRLDGATDDSEIDPAYGQDFGDDVAFKGPGDVAEVIIVLGPVSAADVAAIEGYLKAKYGL